MYLSFVARTACHKADKDAIILGKWLSAVLLACCCSSVTPVLSFAIDRSYENGRGTKLFVCKKKEIKIEIHRERFL